MRNLKTRKEWKKIKKEEGREKGRDGREPFPKAVCKAILNPCWNPTQMAIPRTSFCSVTDLKLP